MFQTDGSPRELSSVAGEAPAAAPAQTASRPVCACSNHSSGSQRLTTLQNSSAARLASYSAECAPWLSKAYRRPAAPLRIRLGIMAGIEVAAFHLPARQSINRGNVRPRAARQLVPMVSPRSMFSTHVDASRASVARCLEFVTKDASSRKEASADLLTNR